MYVCVLHIIKTKKETIAFNILVLLAWKVIKF